MPKKLQAGIDSRWVKNFTSSSFNLGQRGVNPRCCAVRSVRSHHLDHVGNRHDSRPQQDLVPLEPLRVPTRRVSEVSGQALPQCRPEQGGRAARHHSCICPAAPEPGREARSSALPVHRAERAIQRSGGYVLHVRALISPSMPSCALRQWPRSAESHRSRARCLRCST